MKNIGFSDVRFADGYWKTRCGINRDVTLHSVYERFRETYRFDALRCEWKEGDAGKPHVFWDSDVAKWMEGAAYILQSDGDDSAEAIIEDAIDSILKNQDENGYFNSHFLVTEQELRFTDRDRHELYCAGHLMEAAVAYYEATGKDRFLKAMCKYADYIEKVFKTERSAPYFTPGHPELELALVRLARATGEHRYAELAKYFIDEHGKHPEELAAYIDWATPLYNQDDMPIRARETAEGHSVRALYLMCGAADVALEFGDGALKAACERFFENIVNRRMYLTGGVGSSAIGEAFTVDYDLPNRTAYAETCAAIALAMFANRMQQFGAESKYADIVEKVIYNGAMSGVSMDGKSFFYENPLELDPDFNRVNVATVKQERLPITQRLEVFNCSCCPPNILRFVASVGGCFYGDDGETVYVHQYAASEVQTDGIHLRVSTEYPKNGEITVNYDTNRRFIALRIPCWCKQFGLNRAYTLKNGYAYVEAAGAGEVTLTMKMPVRLIAANRRVHADAGRVAVMRGPIVYCAEGVDNGADLKSVALNVNAEFTLADSPFLLPALKTEAYRPTASDALYYDARDDYETIPLTLIPYYAFANRGETEMQVWLLRK